MALWLDPPPDRAIVNLFRGFNRLKSRRQKHRGARLRGLLRKREVARLGAHDRAARDAAWREMFAEIIAGLGNCP
jgi:hypothetical protein